MSAMTAKAVMAATVAVLLCAATMATAATPVPSASTPPPDLAALQQQVDALVSRSYEEPEAALAEIGALEAALATSAAAAERRTLLLGRGLIVARAGRVAQAQASAQALSQAARAGDSLAEADAELVLASLGEMNGQSPESARHAHAAVAAYQRSCGPDGPRRDTCDPSARWRALAMLANISDGQGDVVAARQHRQMADQLARASGDVYRQAWGLSSMAVASQRSGERDLARRQMAQAERLARLQGSPDLMVRVKVAQAVFADARDEPEAVRAALKEALAQARKAHAPRLEATVLTNLSDGMVKQGQPREALELINRALVTVRLHNDQRTERVLLHNATLAHLGLGRLAEAQRDLPRLLSLWEGSGRAAELAEALREFGDALAGAGDHAGALALYHRERKLASDLMLANRDNTLRELRGRYDREAQQRGLELAARNNALLQAELQNRALAQQVWAMLVAVLVGAALTLVLLYRRVRRSHRALERNQAQLRVQSERDPLTGLANRRRLYDTMQAHGANVRLEGALLLVDIDHFKRVNDERGHAAGDEVLIEVARRLKAAVRADDLVVRWGGEEFLVFAPGIDQEQLHLMAQRVLKTIGTEPIRLNGGRCEITVSIGYAGFPLPEETSHRAWEPAVDLVDMALYTAKNQGRNRAVGILSVESGQPGVVRETRNDFDGACRAGKVNLRVTA